MTGVLEGQWQLNGMIFVGIFFNHVDFLWRNVYNRHQFVYKFKFTNHIYHKLIGNRKIPGMFRHVKAWTLYIVVVGGSLYIVVVGGSGMFRHVKAWTLHCCLRVRGSMLCVNFCLLLKYISVLTVLRWFRF